MLNRFCAGSQRTTNCAGLCSLWPAEKLESLQKSPKVKTWRMETSSLATTTSNTSCSGSKSTRSRWKKRWSCGFDRCSFPLHSHLYGCHFYCKPFDQYRWRSRPARQSGFSRTVSIRLMLPSWGLWKWEKHWAIICWCRRFTTNSSSPWRWETGSWLWD